MASTSSPITVTVQMTDRKFTVSVPSDIQVSAFKRRIQADVGCPPELHRLVHRGRILADDKSFAFYGKLACSFVLLCLYYGFIFQNILDDKQKIYLFCFDAYVFYFFILPIHIKEIQDGHNVHFVKGGARTTPTTPTTTTTAPIASTTVPNALPPGFQSPFGGMGGMGGMGGLGGMGMGGMGSMAEMEEQLRRNPQMMQEMMNSPLMRGIMENPDMLQSMFANNPQMEALMNSNPELRHALTDPATLRQSMQMMRNPQGAVIYIYIFIIIIIIRFIVIIFIYACYSLPIACIYFFMTE
jgi:hypothetical protein